jgi:hypothetical protein
LVHPALVDHRPNGLRATGCGNGSNIERVTNRTASPPAQGRGALGASGRGPEESSASTIRAKQGLF